MVEISEVLKDINSIDKKVLEEYFSPQSEMLEFLISNGYFPKKPSFFIGFINNQKRETIEDVLSSQGFIFKGNILEIFKKKLVPKIGSEFLSSGLRGVTGYYLVSPPKQKIKERILTLTKNYPNNVPEENLINVKDISYRGNNIIAINESNKLKVVGGEIYFFNF